MAKASNDAAVTASIHDPAVQAVFRRAGWVAAIVALLVGLFGLIFPQTALSAVALIIGVYLVVSGISRIGTAWSSREVDRGWRIALGAVGGLVILAGVLVLNNPIGTMIFIVIVTGIAWIVDGIGYLLAAYALRGTGGPSAIALGIAGAILVVAGIVVMVVPNAALAGMLFMVCILLVVFGGLAVILLGFATARARSATRA